MLAPDETLFGTFMSFQSRTHLRCLPFAPDYTHVGSPPIARFFGLVGSTMFASGLS